MGTAAETETVETDVTPLYSLTNPPPGAYFDYDEVKGDRGQKTLGTRPLLTWRETQEGLDGYVAFYGVEGALRIANGTSVRVTAQGIARRITEKGIKEKWSEEKINSEIAKLQLEYRPGKRQGGQSTAQSRAVNAAKKAAGKISGDAIAATLEMIAGMSDEQRAAFAAQFGLKTDFTNEPEESEEDEVEENGNSTEPQA